MWACESEPWQLNSKGTMLYAAILNALNLGVEVCPTSCVLNCCPAQYPFKTLANCVVLYCVLLWNDNCCTHVVSTL